MNATDSYLATCRYLMGADVDDPGAWVEIQRLLSGTRLALTCCVCGRLLRRPMGQSPSVCHHHVCRDCVGGKMRYIKRGCGWCKSFDEFVANARLECIVRCFRQLCRYLGARAARMASSLAVDAAVSSVLGIIQEAVAVDDGGEGKAGETGTAGDESEGIRKTVTTSQQNSCERIRSRKRMKISQTSDDNESDKEICFNYKKSRHDHVSSANSSDNRLSNGKPFNSFASDEVVHRSSCRAAEKGRYAERKSRGSGRSAFTADSSHDTRSELNGFDSGCDSEKKLENSILAEHDYNKCTADETDTNVSNSNWTSEEEQTVVKRSTYSRDQTEIGRRSKSSSRDFVADSTVSSAVGSTVVGSGSGSSGANGAGDSLGQRFKNKGKSGCRCALAAPNPGKLTCCGQRCPCYAAFQGCDNCKCRGCRNPRGDPRNLPASLLRAMGSSQTVTSPSHSSLHKISTTIM